MGRLFGTDGVRGLANRDLTAEVALDLSVAAAHVLSDRGEFAGHRPTAVVGRDPRASGEFLAAAVVAGLASAGVDVTDAGVVPTPAVAHLVGARDADLGVMISASHNAMPDNGIKLFARGGVKLDDAVEDQVEARLEEPWNRPLGADVGRIVWEAEAWRDYVSHVVAATPHRLEGLSVVVDCANGAASTTTPYTLRALGAEVHALHDQPDGLNINDRCGSTHPESLQAAVVALGADAGIAHDGDADRCLAVDADGAMVDGDQIMAVLALARRDAGQLIGNTLVSTVMSNEGLRVAMRAHGVDVLDTAVGDRYVLEAMRTGGYTFGGEQSGHIVMLDHATTGDGLLTAVFLLSQMAAAGKSLAELASVVQPLPQVLVNVADVDRSRASTDRVLLDEVRAAAQDLHGRGRVLLRPSGTENLVRVMVEAPSAKEADRVAEHLAEVVRRRLG